MYHYTRTKTVKLPISHKKQKKCEYKDSRSHISRNSDKNCEEKENSNMQSVTKKSYHDGYPNHRSTI